MNISTWQNQIICGTLFGNGYISRTNPTYLGMSESHNKDWIRYKGQELESIQSNSPFSHSGKVIKWRSKSNAAWCDYYDKFYYKNKKRADMEVLNYMRDISLAIWFGDKGFWYSSQKLGLRTTAFGESNNIICKYFNEVSMPCETRVDSHGATRIIFDRKGTQRFLETIADCLPEFMHNRLKS